MVSDSEDEDELQKKAKRSIGRDDEDVPVADEPKEGESESIQPAAPEEYDSDEGVRNE